MNQCEEDDLKGVAVIIVYYQNRPELLACLATLIDSGFPIEQVYVSNNGHDNYSSMHGEQVLSGDNVGFAGGVNRAIRHIGDLVEWYLLLNPDAHIEVSEIRKLISFGRDNSDVGFVAPGILEDSDRVWSMGGSINWGLGLVKHNRMGERPDESSGEDEVLFVDYAPGCVLLVRRAMLNHVGLMDEEYFMYFEDVDWCVRAQRAGYSTAVIPGIRALHSSGWRTDSWAIRKVLAASIINSRRFFKRYSGSSKTIGAVLSGMKVVGSFVRRGYSPIGAIIGLLQGLLNIWPYKVH